MPGMLCRVALARTNVLEERRFLQEPHGITSQKTAFFITSLTNKNILIVFTEGLKV
jgi:hypothetical protein